MKFLKTVFNLCKVLAFLFFFTFKIYGSETQAFWHKFYITTGIEAFRFYKDITNVVKQHSEKAPFLLGVGYDINEHHSVSINFMDFDFAIAYNEAPFGKLFTEYVSEQHELKNIDITYTYYFLNSKKGKFMFVNIFTIENHNIDINVDILGALGQKLNFNAPFLVKNNMFKTGLGYRFLINKYMDINLYYLLGMYQKVDHRNYDPIRELGAQIPDFERFNHFVEVNLIWHF